MVLLGYGSDSQVTLELEADVELTVCDAPRGQPLDDVAGATAAALRDPLEYPPLAQAALPGDRVVLALETGVPQAAAIVAETIAALMAAGVSASGITVLAAAPEAAHTIGDSLASLPEESRGEVSLLVHDAHDRKSLSYLAAAADASPVYLHRAIHDADLVISIGVLRLPNSLGYHGIHSGLFPTFSDAATQARFRAPKAIREVEQEKLRKLADEVGWLVGTRFTVQVVPGADEQILHVLAGDFEVVMAAGSRLSEAAWGFPVPARAGLVVATLGGDQSQQTWQNVARALGAAVRVLDDHGDVILCTRLEDPPGPAIERMIGSESLNVALREITRDKSEDSLVATQLGEALERGSLYLVSDLNDPRLEDLGVLPLDPDDVSRVAGRYASCIVLANAQYAQAWVESEAPASQAKSRRSRS